MRKTFLTILLPAVALAGPAGAQDAAGSGDRFSVPGTDASVKIWTESGVEKSAVSRRGGSWIPLPDHQFTIRVRERVFDPLVGDAALPPLLLARHDNQLFFVQFKTDIIPEYRGALDRLGAEVTYYIPNQAYLVRMPRAMVDVVSEQPYVRVVSDFHTGYRLDSDILASVVAGVDETARYNVVVINEKTDVPATVARIQALGGTVHMSAVGDILIEATLTSTQLMQLANDNTVLWIDRWTPAEQDIDLARIQTGANYVESQIGDDFGKGLRGHIFEGVHRTHPEFGARLPFRQAPISLINSASDSHGTNTAGEIYAQGASALYKGMLPYAQLIYTNYSGVNRSTMTNMLVDPGQQYKAMLQTASWGNTQTIQYTSVSQQLDQILFNTDLFCTNSQSNTGNRNSRPQAWAKNCAGIGGFYHRNNTNPGDDCWCGGASIGPAADGRVGPTFTGYYESIRTTSGSSGYTTTFGGTSGATPMVNGLCGQAMQMYGDGLFGYPPVANSPEGVPLRFEDANRPHLTTTRVLVALGTDQIPFSRATRVQQGWGLPNVQDLYDNRDKILLLNEEDVLTQGQSRTYYVWVRPNTEQFRASMHHLEPQAAALANPTRINSLDLRVKAPNGDIYWGNGNGILTTPFSAPGGAPNDIDLHENVILQGPVAGGVYEVSVRAAMIRQDSHVETPQMDADFALGVFGIGGGRDKSGMVLDLISDNPSQFDVALTNVPASGWVAGRTLLSVSTQRPLSLGNLFGMEIDSLSLALLGTPPSVGNVFSFLPTATPGVFPNATFNFPAPVAAALQGIEFDAVTWLVDASGSVIEVSNVDRVTVQ